MPFRVYLRPNPPYLAFLLIAVALIAAGIVRSGVYGVLLAVAGAVLLLLFGGPVIVSTICRVPLLAVDQDGVRLPMMGVRLGWRDVARIERTVLLDQRRQPSVLLIVPADPEAAIRHARPWLRREARANHARYGTPIILSGLSMNRSLAEIADALNARSSGRSRGR